MTKAVIVGGLGVDINAKLYDDGWPLPEADGIFAQVGDPMLGHAGSGVALQAAALGLDVVACDVIGDDNFGLVIQREFPQRGVNLNLATHPSGTRRSIILVRADGNRFFLHDPRHPYEMKPDPQLWRSQITDASWVHIVIVNWARQALSEATAAGIVTSTDLQDWDGRSAHHRDFAYGADVVFCSAANLENPNDFVADIFGNGRARIVVVTDGSNGSLTYQRDQTAIHTPATQLQGLAITDTTGAGDAHCAGFMAAYLAGAKPAAAAQQAALVASYASSFPGTNSQLLTSAQLTALMA